MSSSSALRSGCRLVAGVAPMALTACRALSATGAAEERRTLRPRLGLASGHGSGRQSVDSVADHQAGSRCRKPACGAARECAGQHTAAEVERLLRATDDAEAAANQPCFSAEEQRRVIHDAEALAGGEAGVPAKSSHVVRTLQSKWLENLELHGDEYGFDEALGPTIELARHFSRMFHVISVVGPLWRIRASVPSRAHVVPGRNIGVGRGFVT